MNEQRIPIFIKKNLHQENKYWLNNYRYLKTY